MNHTRTRAPARLHPNGTAHLSAAAPALAHHTLHLTDGKTKHCVGAERLALAATLACVRP
jgi:hypothetical protein